MDSIIKDKRFAHIATDARFRAVPQHHRKVKIDRRFNAMFYDDNFKSKGRVDKRGRPQNFDTKENLRKFYDMSSSEDEDEDDDDDLEDAEEDTEKVQDDAGKSGRKKKDKKSPAVEIEDDGDDSDGEESADSEREEGEVGCSSKQSKKATVATKKKIKSKKDSTSDDSDDDDAGAPKSRVDYARGRADIETSSSDDSSSEEEDDTIVQPWGELDKDAPREDEISRRLAVCNIDWDQINARDLYLLLGSFVPTGGMIKSVKIFLSEYGKERLAEEDQKGPKELVEPITIDKSKKKKQDDESEEIIMEKRRLYQLNRLKYYYAVAEFDSAETAAKVYEDCDGLEYEISSSRFDMRFIPDDMTFDEEPHSFADQGFAPGKYKSKEFTTTALQHQTVDITWDQTDPSRMAMIQRVFNKEDEEKLDLKIYIASSSEEEPDSDDDHKGNSVKAQKIVSAVGAGDSSDDEEADQDGKGIAKYRSLLASLGDGKKNKDRDVELEITWTTGLSEKAHPLIQKILDKNEEMSPWEQFLQRKKDKKHKKKEGDTKKEDNNTDSDDDNPYSDDDLPEGVDLENDPFFKENAQIPGEEETGKAVRKSKKKKKKHEEEEEETEEEKAHKAQLALLLLDNEDEKKNHFSLKKLVKKEKRKWGKKKQDDDDKEIDDFKLNVKDPRFSAVYDSHLFNIDPSMPQYKKTKAMEAIVQEKLKRRHEEDLETPEGKKSKLEPSDSTAKIKELSLLVKSVKNKSSNFKASKSKSK